MWQNSTWQSYEATRIDILVITYKHSRGYFHIHASLRRVKYFQFIKCEFQLKNSFTVCCIFLAGNCHRTSSFYLYLCKIYWPIDLLLLLPFVVSVRCAHRNILRMSRSKRVSTRARTRVSHIGKSFAFVEKFQCENLHMKLMTLCQCAVVAFIATAAKSVKPGICIVEWKKFPFE